MSASPARITRAAVLVWVAGLIAYILAVACRTSFGVAGTQAIERFDVNASVLSLFVVVQLAVYAAAQVPVGVLLDRVGSRWVLTGGAALLAVGDLALAFAHNLPLAMAARVLIGLGDATALVSVLRLIPAWFPRRHAPMLAQLTTIVGLLGQVVSAVPFMAVLVNFGWTPAFAGLAAAGMVVTVLAATAVHDRPRSAVAAAGAGSARTGAPPPGSSGTHGTMPFRAVAHEPGTWLGFFTHFVSLFPTNAFLLLWGVPFLTLGQGLQPEAASALLAVTAVAGLVTGPVAGVLVARHPLRRSWLVLGTLGLVVAVWAAILLRPGPSPFWLLVLLVTALAASSNMSTVGFDYVRTYVPAPGLSTATGIVNVGGTISSLAAILLIGFVLDLVNQADTYAPDDFRIALGVAQGTLWLLGLVGLLIARRATRARMLQMGIVVPPLRDVVARLLADLQEGR